MTVYIDDMCNVPMGQFRRMKMSHMIADTPDELHAFAVDKLRMRREWAQGADNDPGLHYDVAKGKRREAIILGAVPIEMRQLACMVALRRFGAPMGDPETAIERFQKWERKP